MGSCSMSGAPINRSRSAGIASSWAKSKTPSLASPEVTQAVATVHQSSTGAQLVGYVTLDHTTTADDHDAELVEEWQHMYDDLYGAEVGVVGVRLGFPGLEQQLHR